MALKEHGDMLKIVIEEKNEIQMAMAYISIGQDNADGGNYPEAIINFKKALNL